MQTDLQAWSQADADGKALYEQADYSGAISRWLDALISLEETPSNARSRARALKGIALAHGRMGDVEAQLRYLERALEEHYRAPAPTLDEDHRFRAECLCRLGDAYRFLEEYAGAADCFAAAAELADRIQNHDLTVECLMGWGYVAEAAGDVVSALNILNRARDIARVCPMLSDLEVRLDRSIRDMLLAATEL